MESRVQFNNKQSRDRFFQLTLKSRNARGWTDLSRTLSMRRSLLGKYRSGYLCLPFSLYNNILSYFSSEQINSFSSSISFLNNNWGRSKGGEVTYSRYTSVFEEGRKKGLLKFNRSRVKTFDLNQPLNTDLAYFIGLFIGDGFSNKYGGYYLTQFVGHKKHEEQFYREKIASITWELFQLRPKIKSKKHEGFIRVNFYSKFLYLLITNRFGIPAGKKSYTVLIPNEILNSPANILFSCIAGIYDAEACIFIDKRKAYREPYIRIDLHMINPPILKQIANVLEKEGIAVSFTNNFTHLLIYGHSNVSLFLERIKLRNPKHIVKLEKYYQKDF